MKSRKSDAVPRNAASLSKGCWLAARQLKYSWNIFHSLTRHKVGSLRSNLLRNSHYCIFIHRDFCMPCNFCFALSLSLDLAPESSRVKICVKGGSRVRLFFPLSFLCGLFCSNRRQTLVNLVPSPLSFLI